MNPKQKYFKTEETPSYRLSIFHQAYSLSVSIREESREQMRIYKEHRMSHTVGRRERNDGGLGGLNNYSDSVLAEATVQYATSFAAIMTQSSEPKCACRDFFVA